MNFLHKMNFYSLIIKKCVLLKQSYNIKQTYTNYVRNVILNNYLKNVLKL